MSQELITCSLSTKKEKKNHIIEMVFEARQVIITTKPWRTDWDIEWHVSIRYNNKFNQNP